MAVLEFPVSELIHSTSVLCTILPPDKSKMPAHSVSGEGGFMIHIRQEDRESLLDLFV